MSGSNDVISRFRNMDARPDNFTPAETISQYLETSTATSRNELEQGVLDCLPEREDRFKNMRIKRMDRDTDDIFWWFGKIHGLENIAFLDDSEIKKTKGNPAHLQQLVNEVKHQDPPARSFDALVSHAMKNMALYKEKVNQMSLNRSDRTKLLALPFFAQRRTQGPAPKKGMWQYDLFTELAGGKEWNHYDGLIFDPEEKITIYNYEKHLPPTLLETIDTSSDEFKKEIKMATILSKTSYEHHQDLKKNFRELMNILANLNEDEGRSFIHLLQNKQKTDYLEDIHGGELESTLAKISEEENYLAKNSWRLRTEKLDYANKEDFPIEKAKVKDLFKNARDFKNRFHQEVGIYDTLPRMFDYDKRVVQEFIETAIGPLLYLRNEIGLDMAHRFDTSFLRIKDLKEAKESGSEDAILDHGAFYFFNSSFLPLNMTDYEEKFIGPGEDKDFDVPVPDALVNHYKTYYPFNHYNNSNRNPYAKPEEWSEREPTFNFFRNNYQEENAGGDEDDDDDEAEGDEDEIETYNPAVRQDADFDEEEFEPVDWEPDMAKPYKFPEVSPHLGLNTTLRDKYDDIELESFMKFLDVKPFLSWRDTAGFHSRLGIHSVEDFSQRVDPEFHMLGEVEREAFEKYMFKEHRRGSTVRFVVGDTKPNFDSSLD